MCPDNLSPHLNRLEIESAVRGYWDSFAAKKTEVWQSFYADSAMVFATGSKRAEPARLVALRRQREYMATAVKMRVEVRNIDVEPLGPGYGLAVYMLRLHAEQIAKISASGTREHEEHLENARVTHLFSRDGAGRLKIVHEHISAPTA
jgi:ketosteroid isomerase-like protein